MLIQLYGGEHDGRIIDWPDRPPTLKIPVLSETTMSVARGDESPAPMKVLVYRKSEPVECAGFAWPWGDERLAVLPGGPMSRTTPEQRKAWRNHGDETWYINKLARDYADLEAEIERMKNDPYFLYHDGIDAGREEMRAENEQLRARVAELVRKLDRLDDHHCSGVCLPHDKVEGYPQHDDWCHDCTVRVMQT